MSLISVNDLSVAFGRKKTWRKVIQNVSLQLDENELVAVVGPSGSGKSTLFNSIIGLVRPDSGTIKVNGDIGYIPSSPILYLDLTVFQSMLYTAKLRLLNSNTNIKSKILEILTELDLLGVIGQRIKSLSSGEMKRLSVAHELLSSPQILLLDEPTTGLDPTLDVTIMKLLRHLADGGQGIAIITHNLTFVNDYCDKVLILSKLGEPVYYDQTSKMKDIIGTTSWSRIFDWISAHPAEGGEFYRQCHPKY